MSDDESTEPTIVYEPDDWTPTYPTIKELRERAIVPALSHVHKDFDVAALVDKLTEAGDLHYFEFSDDEHPDGYAMNFYGWFNEFVRELDDEAKFGLTREMIASATEALERDARGILNGTITSLEAHGIYVLHTLPEEPLGYSLEQTGEEWNLIVWVLNKRNDAPELQCQWNRREREGDREMIENGYEDYGFTWGDVELSDTSLTAEECARVTELVQKLCDQEGY